MRTFLKFFISIVVCLAVGGVSGFMTASAIPTWYVTLNKPSFNPPNWLFGPVWTTLYIMMGIAFGLVWKSNATQYVKNKAMLFFAIQLVLNFFWSIIFFGYHQVGLALVEIILMWIFILFSIISFKPVTRIGAGLLVPYLAWVSFATILNFSIWRLN